MQRTFWRQGMFTDINYYVHTCLSCQRSKRVSGRPSGLLQPLHIPHGPWDSVSTDFVTGLPKTKAGFDAIVVFVDRLTKYVHIAPTTTKCTAKAWADLFVQHIFCNHGLPLEIISDRGPQFASKYAQALADRMSINWNMSTAFHPQTDGQTERMNRTVEDMLRHFVSPTMTNWDELLVHVQFAINNAWQESVQNTPFYLKHGRHPRTLLAVSLDKKRSSSQKSINPASAALATHLQQTIARAKRCMLNAQQRQKHYYDKRHVPSVFQVGTQVLLATTDLYLRTTGTRKLIPRWVGPFAGWAGSVNDKCIFAHSSLSYNLHDKQMLQSPVVYLDGIPVLPYLVGDAQPMLATCFSHFVSHLILEYPCQFSRRGFRLGLLWNKHSVD